MIKSESGVEDGDINIFTDGYNNVGLERNTLRFLASMIYRTLNDEYSVIIRRGLRSPFYFILRMQFIEYLIDYSSVPRTDVIDFSFRDFDVGF